MPSAMAGEDAHGRTPAVPGLTVLVVDDEAPALSEMPYLLEQAARGGRILTAQVGMTGVRLGVSDLAGNLATHRLVDVAITGGVDIVLASMERGFERLRLVRIVDHREPAANDAHHLQPAGHAH